MMSGEERQSPSVADACSFTCPLTCGGPSDPDHENEVGRARRLLALAKEVESDAFTAWRGAVDAAHVAAARVREAEERRVT